MAIPCFYIAWLLVAVTMRRVCRMAMHLVTRNAPPLPGQNWNFGAYILEIANVFTDGRINTLRYSRYGPISKGFTPEKWRAAVRRHRAFKITR